jgi:branched-chain amino acid transport system substrate-binding protein
MKMKMIQILGCITALLTSHIANAAGISDDVVKIGVLTDMSGAYAQSGGKGSVVAAEMAIADFGGKVLGKPIKVISADHQNKPDVAVTKAREWFDVEKVDMITDLLNSPSAIAVQKIGADKKRITMVTGGGTSALTNQECSPYGVHYVYNTYALATGTANAILNAGHKNWFLLTLDNVFGSAMEKDLTKAIKSRSGKILGTVKHPVNTADFSSYLMQAQSSGAKVIALGNAGSDFTNSLKQAREFEITQKGQIIAGMLVFDNDVKSLGLNVAQGMQFTTAFYWDRNKETRDFANRFFAKHKAMPNMIHAGTYSAVTSYLKAIKAAGTDDPDAVMAKLRSTPINDFFAKNGKIRADGLHVHDMYLVEVKKPSESKGEWDLLKVVATIPADEAHIPLSESTCNLVKK